MRAREFLQENDESSSAGGGDTGRKRPLHKHQKNVMPGATRYPDTPAHYYNMYRFGVHMAGSPDNEHGFDPAGPSGNEMVTLAYSQADLDIIEKSAKAMGFRGARMTAHGSVEPGDTYITSPVSNWMKK